MASLRLIDIVLVISLFALLFAMITVSHRGTKVGANPETSVAHRLEVHQQRQQLLQEAIQNMTSEVAGVYASLELIERLLQETAEKQHVVSAVQGTRLQALFANARQSVQTEIELIINKVEYARDRA